MATMLKSDELKQAINAKRSEVENYQREGKMDLAAQKAGELNNLVDECRAQLALEGSEFNNLTKGNFKALAQTKDRISTRAFNKLVFKTGNLTDEERTAYFNAVGEAGAPGQVESVPARGGYLVPEEQLIMLQEFRKAYVALKDYVNVVATNSTSGRWATLPTQNLEFQSFAELTDIAESDVTFGEATYVIEDRGLIIPISNQLIADADVNIIEVVGRQLAEGAVKAENSAILEPLNTLIVGGSGVENAAQTITSYKGLNIALFKDLDGVYYNEAKVYTNQDGFLWLSNLEDTQNRPLFVPDITAPNKYLYRGKEIVVVPNSTLPSVEEDSNSYAPFFVGSLKAYMTLFERRGLELATSSELYFRRYGTALRAVIRFGVAVTDPAAMVALKVKV